MIIEGRRRKREKKKVEAYEQSPEAVPPTTQEILNNPHLSELLNLILERDKNDTQNLQDIREAAERLQTKLLELTSGEKVELTKDDFEIIDSYRQEIKNIEDKTKEVLDLLTPERIKIIAGSSQDFRRLVGQIGIENTKKFLEVYLSRLMIVDKKGFSELENKLKAIESAEEKLEKINNQLKDLAKKYNIHEKELEEALAIENEDEAKGALKEVIKRNLSTLGRIRNWLSKGKFVEERLEKLTKMELTSQPSQISQTIEIIKYIDEQLEEIDIQLQEIGNMIANAVFATEKGRGWLAETLAAQKEISKPSEMSFVEAGRLLREDELRRGFEIFLGEELSEAEKRGGWDSLGSKRKNELKRKYLDKIREGRRGGIIDILFKMLDQALNQIKSRL